MTPSSKARLFHWVWPLTWPVRQYVRRSPVARGKGLLVRSLLRPLVPPPPATFVTATVGGGRLSLQYAERIGLSTLIHGGFEVVEIECLRRAATPGTTAIDAGANVGVFTVPLATAVGPDGAVMAFEPFPDNVARLEENIELNGLRNVAVHACAMGIITLFLIALVSYMVAYFWTIGQYRGWQFVQKNMKKSTEVIDHGT